MEGDEPKREGLEMAQAIKRTSPSPLDTITPLDGARRAIGILGLVLFVLVFVPIPLTMVGRDSPSLTQAASNFLSLVGW